MVKIWQKLIETVNNRTVMTQEAIDKLNEMYQNMSEYEKTFVAPEKAKALQEYVDRLALLRKNEQPETPETPQQPETPNEEA